MVLTILSILTNYFVAGTTYASTLTPPIFNVLGFAENTIVSPTCAFKAETFAPDPKKNLQEYNHN